MTIERRRNIAPIEKENKFLIALDIAKGMHYLHRGFEGKEPIIHRDLKPENVMVYSILSDRIALELDTKFFLAIDERNSRHTSIYGTRGIQTIEL